VKIVLTARLGAVVGALVVALLLALTSVSPAGAQAGKSKLDAIRARMEKGQELYVAKSYEAAAREFEAGYKDSPYSAFLFNAGVCYQKLGDNARALDRFREYLRVDPSAPDADKVKARIAQLEGASTPPPAGDGGAPPPDAGPTPPPVDTTDDPSVMKSLVVIETDPEGAPFKVYQRSSPSAADFKPGAANEGWKEVAAGRAPQNLTLAVGAYHVVIEKFRDFNLSETDIEVQSGRVYQFKANLSQGAFMAFLRVSANVRGAYVYLDDEKKQRPEWGLTPYGALVPAGKRKILVEAPGFEPLREEISVKQGEQKQVQVKLVRVGYGFLQLDSNAPDIKVRLDDQPVGFWKSGEAPLMVRATAGKHRLTVTGDGRKTFDGEITVPAGQTQQLRVTLIPKYPRGAAWTQAVIGAAFIGAATYFGLESNRLADDLRADRKAGVLEQEDERITRGTVYAIGADVGFAVGGVLAVLATYNFIKDPLPASSVQLGSVVEFEDPRKRKPTARAPRRRDREIALRPESPNHGLRLGPQLGLGGAGLSIGGSF
jgi:tetratricopeptide (TPR) repeat protein